MRLTIRSADKADKRVPLKGSRVAISVDTTALREAIRYFSRLYSDGKITRRQFEVATVYVSGFSIGESVEEAVEQAISEKLEQVMV